jgi:fucose permease
VLALGSTTFFALGVMLVLLGASQADITRDLALDLTTFGFLGAVFALGMAVGVTGAGPLADRWPRRPLFVAACLAAGLALVTVTDHTRYVRLTVHLAVSGCGCGMYITVLNAAAVDRWKLRAAAALAMMHSAATAGASCGPLLIAWCNHGGHWNRTFHALGAMHLALALWGGLYGLPESRAVTTSPSARVHTAWTSLISLELLALCAMTFAYVGVETGLTLFALPWAESRDALPTVGRAGISAFWCGLLAGRLGVVVHRGSPNATLLVACGLAGAIVVWASAAIPGTPFVVAMAAAGLALGPVYPVLISLAARRFPHAVGTASGMVGGAGAGGGFLVPWLGGVVGDAFGIRSTVALLGASALLIALGAAVLARRTITA